MYNNYTRGSEAWLACKEASESIADVEDTLGAVETTFEGIIDQLDDAINGRDEEGERADQAELEAEKYKGLYEELHASSSELITLITNLLVAGDAVSHYCTEKLKALGALNESENRDSSGGDSLDGGAKTTPVKDAG